MTLNESFIACLQNDFMRFEESIPYIAGIDALKEYAEEYATKQSIIKELSEMAEHDALTYDVVANIMSYDRPLERLYEEYNSLPYHCAFSEIMEAASRVSEKSDLYKATMRRYEIENGYRLDRDKEPSL